jgi:hypothetical protein
LAEVAPADVASAIDAPLLAGGESDATVGQLEIEVSETAADGVSISTGDGMTTIGLPFADKASPGSSYV